MTDAKALRVLLEDPRLSELEEHVSSLSLFRALDVYRDEVAHSRVLAALLNPRRHRGAEKILRTLLGKVLKVGLDNDFGQRLGEIVPGPWEHVSVRREHLFIDVVVEISSPRGAAVVGIENKIHAGEQERQISRYQDALGRVYPGRAAVVVFLTPTGREPTTADPHSPVPVVALGYETVQGAVEEAWRETTPGSREAGCTFLWNRSDAQVCRRS